jgi:hypothetical protein
MHNLMYLDEATADFYRGAMRALIAGDAPFLVGGAYAFERYTGIARHSKDFDIFVRESDLHRVMSVLRDYGCRTEIAFPHWLGKAWRGADYVDVIYGSGNGVAMVDDLWFEHAVKEHVLGVEAWLIPAEEMIWSKGFIMERERFDGADVAHVIHARAEQLDWGRLIARFDHRWRILYAHLVLFGFIYPGDRARIPPWVMRELTGRLGKELEEEGERSLCQGTIVSRQQYLHDLAKGYEDARLRDDVHMSDRDIELWTEGIAVDGEGAKR